MIPAYVDSAAVATARRWKPAPAFTAPLRSCSPWVRSTGRDSPVRADSSSTPAADSRIPSTGITSPCFTSNRSPTTTSSIGIDSSPPSTTRCAVRGARESSADSSACARASAKSSSERPVDSMNAITAPARYSWSASEPTIASTAIRSTPASRRQMPRATSHAIGTRPKTVVAAQTRSAASGSSATHRSTAPTTMPSVDRAKKIAFAPRKRRRANASDPREPRPHVRGERDVSHRHVQLVGQGVAPYLDAASQLGDRGSRRAQRDRGCSDLDQLAFDRPLRDLGDPERMSQYELHAAAAPWAQEPSLEVDRARVVGRPAALRVHEERLPDVLERHLLFVAEGLSAGPLALAIPPPVAEQERERLRVRMQRGLHRSNATTGPPLHPPPSPPPP